MNHSQHETSGPATDNAKIYLYAITAEADEHAYNVKGIDETTVYTISNGQVAAVVSPIPQVGKIRPQRRHLAAHHQVLKHLMTLTTPLPMAFGIIADDVQAVHNILSRHQETLSEQLRRVANKVEIGLRVNWNVPNIFEYFISSHAELQELRDKAFRSGEKPARDELIEIGRRFNLLLEEDRKQYTDTVERALFSYCVEIKRNKCREEREVMNLACLVDRSSTEAFEKGLHQVAKSFNDDFIFDYNGPWAPHNFVDLSIIST